MGLRDLIFGKDEDEEGKNEEETSEDELHARFGQGAQSSPPQKKPVTPPSTRPVSPPVSAPAMEDSHLESPVADNSPSSPEVDAEVKEIQASLQAERKEKGLGQEYYGYLKALGEEEGDAAHQRTLRSVNAVREQFGVGQALTWGGLAESAKQVMAWLSTYSKNKVAKLQGDHRTVSANLSLQAEKAAMAIQEAEAKIKQLQQEIEAQKVAQQKAKDAQAKAQQEYDRKKAAIDSASVKLATDIANDIANYQRQS